MAQPFDYTIPSPQDAFQSSFVFGQRIAAQQAAQQQAQQKAMEAQQARAAMQEVYEKPTPENLSRFYLNYPAYKEQFEAARQPLTDAAKADDLDFSSRTFALLTNGAVEEADALMQARIQALKNTPGKEQEAAATEAIAKTIKADPKAGRQLFAMKLAAANPKGYEEVYGKTDKAYEVVPGVGVVLKRDIERAIASGQPTVQTAIPEAAINDLRRQPNTARQFDEVFGAGSAARVLGMGGTAAPEMDASGTPTTLTRPQYIATVQALGKAKTDAWVQANNITVSDR